VAAALHVAMLCLIGAGLVWACRFLFRLSRWAGLMFAAGLVIRAAAGTFFLAVSYYGLPLMKPLQMGGGFWTLASDAQEYYRLASLVAGEWQETITPGYVGPLALWMRAVGVNPASPVLFSLVMYAVAIVIFATAFRDSGTRTARQAFHLGVAALSFSPMLVYAAVFGLKDVFFTALVVGAVVVCLTLLVSETWTRATPRRRVLSVAAGLLAAWLIAGIRAYFAILLWLAIAVTYAGCIIAGLPPRRRFVTQAAAVLPALAIVIALGAEGNYPRFVRSVIVSVPSAVLTGQAPLAHGGIDELDRRREAIDDYGGNSMLTRPSVPAVAESAPAQPAGAEAPPAEPAAAEAPSRLRGIAVGVGAMLLPGPLLGPLTGVDLHLGAASRLIAEADTLFFDVSAALVLWMAFVNRRRASRPPLVFSVALAVLVALPLAYVMTNYGTLIRLRLLVSVPLWLLTLALAPGFAAEPPPAVPAPTRSPADTPAPSGAR
jgi:hypothetical protein